MGFIFYIMAQDKKGFILYADQKSLFEKLPNEKAGELIKHIFRYVNDENPTTKDLLIEIAFEPIKNQLKRDLIKFEKSREQRSEAGKKSAALRKEQREATKFNGVESRSTKSTVIDNVTVKVNDTVKVIKEREADFKKSLLPFFEKGIIGEEDIKEFISYWTEHGDKDKKMRFEKQKSFSLERRIGTWLKNKKDWEKEKSADKKEKLILTEQDFQNLMIDETTGN